MAKLGLDKDAIEANQLRIWEELKRRKESGELAAAAPGNAEAAPKAQGGMFAGIKEAWDKMYAEADSMAYAQAVTLSADLEKKGMLPKVVTADGFEKRPAPDGEKKKGKKSRSKAKAKKSRGFG